MRLKNSFTLQLRNLPDKFYTKTASGLQLIEVQSLNILETIIELIKNILIPRDLVNNYFPITYKILDKLNSKFII
jgi:hypothetical protein